VKSLHPEAQNKFVHAKLGREDRQKMLGILYFNLKVLLFSCLVLNFSSLILYSI